ACEGAGGVWLVGEGEVGGGAVGRGSGKRVVKRVCQRLGGRGRSASAGCGSRQGGAARRDGGGDGDENDEASGRECANELQSDPFSGASSLVVAPEIERFLRACS